MATYRSFEDKVKQLEESMLSSIAQPGEISEVVEHLMRGCFPYAVTENQGATEMKAVVQDDKVAFRHTVRILLDSVVKSAAEARSPLMSYVQPPGSQPTAARLLDTVLWLCDHELVESGMIFTLLEDLVEAATIDECRDVFTFIEERVAILRKPHLFDGKFGGKLVMLRCCNQLLRRLSKGNNAMLCGRISMLLAWLLPIWDKSGANMRGEVNMSNPLVIEDVQEGAVDSNGAPIDVQFYRTFWGLQKYFQAPESVLESENWSAFCAGLDRVLDVFSAQPLVSGGTSSQWSESSVKYLTSSKLIGLQLQDPSFRRQFMVQCLILFRFARDPVIGKEKKAGLSSQQLEQAAAMEKKVTEELISTPDCGLDFTKSVKKLLERESAWVAWKAEGAPAFDRPPAVPYVPPASPAPKRKRVQARSYKVQLGTEELDSLWNLTETNMSSLRAEDRGDLPTCREFLENVIDQMNPEEGIEEEFKQKNDDVYKWKALRMLARQNLQVFSDTIEKADGDLEYAVLKLYPDDIKGVDAQAVLQKYIQPDPKKEGGKAALLKEDSKEAKPPPAKAPAPAAKDS